MSNFRRTMLFMPGDNPGMLQSAPILGADSVILDLEDAVSLTEKDSARILVTEAIKFLDYSGVELVVRINPLDTEFSLLDIDNISRVKPDALMIPKASIDDISEVDRKLRRIEEEQGFYIGTIKLIPIIETAFGLEKVYEIIMTSKRVEAVLLGGEDLTSDFEINRTKTGEEIFYARCRISAACRAAGVDAIDTPFTDINDMEGLIKDTLKAKSLGYKGKAVINPRQIDSIHKVFTPDSREIKYALRVLEARDEALGKGIGVFSMDGKMVDAPVISRAVRIIELAKLFNIIK